VNYPDLDESRKWGNAKSNRDSLRLHTNTLYAFAGLSRLHDTKREFYL